MLDDPNDTLTSNRVYSSNGEWVALPSGGGGSGIPVTATATDANDATTTGIYTNVTGNTPYAGTATNHTLFVIAGSNGNIQQYDTYNSTSQRGIWVRSKHGTSSSNTTAGTSDLTSEALTAGWTSWRKIAAGGSGGGTALNRTIRLQHSTNTFGSNITDTGGNFDIPLRVGTISSTGESFNVSFTSDGYLNNEWQKAVSFINWAKANVMIPADIVAGTGITKSVSGHTVTLSASGGGGGGGPNDTIQVLKVNSFTSYTLDLTSASAATGTHTHTG
jgi:hypothetical protein